MKVRTETLTISITAETAMMLRALNKARNGSLNNTTDSAISHGIEAILGNGPQPLRERFEQALIDGRF